MKPKLCVVILILLSCLTELYASGKPDEQLWSDVYLVHGSRKIELQHRIGNRFLFEKNTNVFIHYRFRSTFGSGIIKYRLGTALFYAQEGTAEVFEFRPWGGLQLNFPLNNVLQLRNYVRLENRFLHENSDHVLDDPEGRLRYRFGIKSWLVQGEQGKLGVRFTPEVFFDFGSYNSFTYNELRILGGLTYNYNGQWVAGVNYIRQVPQDNALDISSLHTNIFQITLKRFIL